MYTLPAEYHPPRSPEGAPDDVGQPTEPQQLALPAPEASELPATGYNSGLWRLIPDFPQRIFGRLAMSIIPAENVHGEIVSARELAERAGLPEASRGRQPVPAQLSSIGSAALSNRASSVPHMMLQRGANTPRVSLTLGELGRALHPTPDIFSQEEPPRPARPVRTRGGTRAVQLQQELGVVSPNWPHQFMLTANIAGQQSGPTVRSRIGGQLRNMARTARNNFEIEVLGRDYHENAQERRARRTSRVVEL